MKSLAALLVLAVVVANPPVADAQGERRDHEVAPSGLTVAFPSGYACEPVASPFASPTRYDGSRRRGDRNNGLHGGIDITLDVGTPLLAIADGEVIARGEGGALEGIYLWLRHPPEATGSRFFVFSKYQHLSVLPTLEPGQQVKAGTVVGLSGATGTAGKHYGPGGYPHLHLTTFFGPSGDFELRGMYGSIVSASGAQIDDPLLLYLDDVAELSEVRRLPDERRTVRPAVVDTEANIVPPGRRVVWPVACRKG